MAYRAGGGGASGSWGRRSYAKRTPTQGRTRTTRSKVWSRGGSTHFVTSLYLPPTGVQAEAFPTIAVVPFIHGGMWLDYQEAGGLTGWEGQMDATRIVHIQAWVDLWRTSAPEEGVILKLPLIVAFGLLDLFDAAPSVGDPNDFTPTTLPDLYSRSFGQRERGVVGVNPDRPAVSPFDSSARILYRAPVLMPAGAFDDNSLSSHRVSWNSRRGFTIRRLQALCLILNGYNTLVEGNAHYVGARLYAHFGYRHFKRS